MDENKFVEETAKQGPVCSFCYKWCPRMLMLIGILVVIGNILFVFLYLPQRIYIEIHGGVMPDRNAAPSANALFDLLNGLISIGNNIFIFISIITTLLVLFTLLLKMLRAHI